MLFKSPDKSLLIVLFVLTKAMDLFTTYLVTDDLSNEISLLVTGLHFGWFGFIIVNRFFVLTVVILILFTNLKFVNTLEQKNKKVIFSLKDYICKIILSTNDDLTKIGLIQLLFKIKMNKLSFLFFSIRSFTVTMIIIHILVSLNNIFEYGGFSIWGNTKYFIISNIIFLLIIVLFVVVFYMMIKKRFHRLSSNI